MTCRACPPSCGTAHPVTFLWEPSPLPPTRTSHPLGSWLPPCPCTGHPVFGPGPGPPEPGWLLPLLSTDATSAASKVYVTRLQGRGGADTVPETHTCASPGPCTLRHREQVIQHQNCSSTTPVRLTYCEGVCGDSTAKYGLSCPGVPGGGVRPGLGPGGFGQGRQRALYGLEAQLDVD